MQRRPISAYALGYQFGRLILPIVFLWLLVESCSSAGRLLTVFSAERTTDCITLATDVWMADKTANKTADAEIDPVEVLHFAGWAMVTGRLDEVERDPVEGAMCLLAAAEWGRGYAPSQRLLGAMYGAGIGVPQDWVEAYYWTSLAVMQGENDDIGGVSSIAALAAQIADEELTADQLEEARRRVREWHDRWSRP